jgi:hypothetical protein
MSDQPGIPALTVFPPFNPAASRPTPPPAQPSVPAPSAEAESAAGAAAAAGPESADALPAEPESAPGPVSAEAPEPMPWDADLPGLEAPETPAAPLPWDAAAPAAPADEPAPWDVAPAAESEGIAPWDAAPAVEPAAGAETWEPKPPAVELDFAGDPALWTSDADDGDDVADPLPWDYEAPELQTPEAAEAAADEAPGEEDLPWLELPPSGPRVHAVEEPAAEAPEPALDAAPDWMDWAGAGEETAAPAEDRAEPDVLPIGDLEAAAEPPAAEVPAPFAEAETTSVAHGGSWLPPAEEERSDAEVAAEWAHPESAAAPAAAPEAAPAPSAALAGAFDDVAARLESIAHALRDDPQAFLSGAGGGGDPLSLLVAGFALGVNAARGVEDR